jgi:hypothetical protein
MKNSYFSSLAVSSGLLLMPFATSAAPIECPQSITEQPMVSMANSAWSVVAHSGERQVEQAGVYIGIGKEYGAQVPDSTKISNREEQVTWRMPAPGAEKYWLGCSYSGTSAMLVIELKPEIQSCLATYMLLPTGKRQRLKRIDCR